jgi:hypothetical protein
MKEDEAAKADLANKKKEDGVLKGLFNKVERGLNSLVSDE